MSPKVISLFLLFFMCLSAFVVAQNQEETSLVSSPFNQAKFVPDISFILDGSLLTRTMSNEMFSSLQTLGFFHTHENNEHEESLPLKGFAINYGELSLYSVVDPYFDLFAVLHLAPEHAGLEEVYFTTRQLPYGFQLKAGKFLSGFGRLNEQHNHTLDFADRPLILTSFFGNEGFNEVGTRLTWVAPLNFYLMFGAEALMGENEQSFGRAGIADPYGNVALSNIENPSLAVGYIKSSFDLEEVSVLIGTSVAQGKFRHDHEFSNSEEPTGKAIDGSTTLWGTDLTIKYTVDPIRLISFQTEFLHRTISGTLFERETTTVSSSPVKLIHSGFYAQLVAKTGLRWRVGARYDLLLANKETRGVLSNEGPTKLPRYSAMVEYNASEFSRFRLQLIYDKSKYLAEGASLQLKPFTELQLQYTIGIGAHGAHSF